MRNLFPTHVPRSAQTMVATLWRTIFAQPDHESVWAQCTEFERLGPKRRLSADYLDSST